MTVPDQLASAKREAALRRNVYPKWIRDGRLRQEVADHEIAAMEAIVKTLEKLQALQEVSEEMKRKA